MAINSVNSSVNASTQLLQQNQNRTQKPNEITSAEQVSKARESQQQQVAQSQRSEQPKHVVNTQGQTTGGNINTTA